MAQSVGYTNDISPSDLPEHADNSKPLINGQPPQFGKLSSMKPVINQHIMNSSGLAISNGPPSAHPHSTPGSLSSHSSRNASPTPPARPIGISQSMENLSLSAGVVNNRSQLGNQLASSRANATLGTEGNQPLIKRMGSVPSDLHQELVDQTEQGQKEPSSKPPHRLNQNIPLQSISENNQNHSENPRISTSVHHSSLSSSRTQPLTAAQPSSNDPTTASPSQTNHVNPSNSLPPMARTNASGTLPSTTARQQLFPNGPSINPPSNPKPSFQLVSQMAQNPRSVPQNLVSETGTTSQQFQGQFSEMSQGSGQPPVSQYSGATSIVDSGQIPGSSTSQYTNMSSTNRAVSNPLFHHQSASGPNIAGNNRTVSPGMPPSSSPGLNLTPNTQQSSHPDMPPSRASEPNVASNIRTFSPGILPTGFNQAPNTQSSHHTIPPSSSSGPNMNPSRTLSPGMVPPGPSGYNQPSNTQQPAYPGMPPTSVSGVKSPSVSNQAYNAGASQPPANQYPGMPPSSVSGSNAMTSNRTISPGMPLTSAPGFNQPSNIQQPPYTGVPPTSASGPNVVSNNRTVNAGFSRPSNIQQPGMQPSIASGDRPLPVSHQANAVHGNQQPSQYPGMPPNSAAGVGPLLGGSQIPTSAANQAPATSVPGIRQSPISNQGPSHRPSPQYPGMPPTSASGMPSTPGGGKGHQHPAGQYLGMPLTSASGIPTIPGGGQARQHPAGQYLGMPPTSMAGGSPLREGSQNQHLVNQYPDMPPASASGFLPIPGGNQTRQHPSSQYPGIPPISSSGIPSIPASSQHLSGQYPGKPPMNSSGIPPIPGSNQHPPSQYPGMPPTRIPPIPGSSQQYPGMPPTSTSGIPPISGSNQQYPGMPPASSSGIPPISGSNQQYPGMPPTSSSGVRPTPAGHLVHTAGAGQQRPSVYPGMPPGSTGANLSSSQMRYPAGSSQLPPPSSHPSQFQGASSGPITSGVPPTGQYPGMPPVQSPSAGVPPHPPSSSNVGGGESHHSSRRYPQQPGYPIQSQPGVDALPGQMSNMSITQTGFNKLWGLEYYDLLQVRNILPPEKVEPPKIALHQEYLDSVNCSTEIFRCTLTKIPESNSLLQKARLPLGILIHPFKDLNHLPVIQCSTIVRCRACRTYINPFVYFVDQKRWKCNLCFRVNELPEEFQYDPVTKTYGCPTRRPEIKSSTMEFIAPSEYMLRPPQPAVYLFLLDVSQMAVESGYLQLVCDILRDEFDKMPGDARTQIGFITFDSTVHFYNLGEGLTQPQQMIVVDIDDIFLPRPDNLLVNLSESRELIRDLLTQLPHKFRTSHDPYSVMGPALQVAFKLMSPTGGRMTVFQSCLPTKGPGALAAREDPSQRAGKEAPHLNPAIDFYKRLALDCSGQQVAVDLFVLNSQYCDLATISGVSRFSGGCIHHFPLFKASNTLQAESFERIFRRYLKRKIGFEAVMRIRCSRGLAIHTFHGNFFVRSTDLLSLPNVNPDAGFGMQVSIEESLSELQNVCFQAALLYTTSKGERRIRVHTLCLPVATTLPDILHSADQQCIVGLLAKMAVDRSLQTSLSDAREAFINVAIDVLSAYRVVQSSGAASGLLAPHNLRLLPLYILALLKYVAFRSGQSTRLDDRVFAMCQMKTLPLTNLIQAIYPDMYPVHCLEEQLVALEDGSSLPQPPRLHLSAEKLDQRGVFLLDTGDHMMLYVGRSVSVEYCTDVFGVPSFSEISEEMYELPVLETTRSLYLRKFIEYLQSEKPYPATVQVIRDDGHFRTKFIERLIEDRTESAFSYYEFLQHLKTNVK